MKMGKMGKMGEMGGEPVTMDFVTLTGLPTLSGRRETNLSGCEAADRVGVQNAQNLPVISIIRLDASCIQRVGCFMFYMFDKIFRSSASSFAWSAMVWSFSAMV